MNEKMDFKTERLIKTYIEYSSMKKALHESNEFVSIDPIPKWGVVGFEVDWFIQESTRDLWALIKGDGPCPAGWSCEYRAINEKLS